jgi:hypothetical protein
VTVFGDGYAQDGRMVANAQYNRTYVETALNKLGVLPLSAAQSEALDLVAALAEAACLALPFREGNLQLSSNHTVYHGRAAYADDAPAGTQRSLFRLWLSVDAWGRSDRFAHRGSLASGRPWSRRDDCAGVAARL